MKSVSPVSFGLTAPVSESESISSLPAAVAGRAHYTFNIAQNEQKAFTDQKDSTATQQKRLAVVIYTTNAAKRIDDPGNGQVGKAFEMELHHHCLSQTTHERITETSLIGVQPSTRSATARSAQSGQNHQPG